MEHLSLKRYTRKQLITAGCIASGGLLALSALAYGKKYFNGSACTVTQDLTGKVVVITGANSGIGKETARELAKLNATVIVACRNTKKTLPVIEELKKDTNSSKIEFIYLDLASLKSIEVFADEFKSKYDRLDILINNAGIMALPRRKATKDGFEAQFGTNHLGHFYLTQLLLDTIKASAPSRIINVTSNSHLRGKINWDDLMYQKDYSPMVSYTQSKLANVMFTKELQRRMDMEDVDIKVVSVHPGAVRTESNRYQNGGLPSKVISTLVAPVYYYFTKSPNQGAQTTLYCALEDHDDLEGGGYYDECREARPNPFVTDTEFLARLWNVSQNLIDEKLIIESLLRSAI